jgi:hypothetical protein
VSVRVNIAITTEDARLALGRVILFAAYIYFVLSNTRELRDTFPNEFKHYFFILYALLNLIICPVQAIRAMVMAVPIAIIYVLGGIPIYAAMVLVFAAALPLLGYAVIDIVHERRFGMILLMGLISLLPAAISLPSLLGNGLLDTTYGRPRLLLGYWHPKEAGIAFGIPLFLTLMSLYRGVVAFCVLATGFIWVVGSRNVSILLPLACALRYFPRATPIILGSCVGVAILMIFANDDLYRLVDVAMSLRLSVWADAMSIDTSSLDVDFGSRFAVDSFFIETFVLCGWIGIMVILQWLVLVLFVNRKMMESRVASRSAMWMLLSFAAFDSGIASTGNMMHVVLWTLVLAPMISLNANLLSEQPFRLRAPAETGRAS